MILPTEGVFTGCCFELYGDNNRIEFGNRCRANNASFYIEDSNNAIIVGQNTYFAGKIHIACTESRVISIGENCLLSSDVVIRSGDSHSVTDLDGNRINQAKDVIISDHVWVGHRVLINKGVSIPQNCIIGTGAVLTKRFEEENTVIAGVPAKIVKKNVNWDTKRINQ